VEEGYSLVGYLTTTGRVTGTPYTVPLRLVCYQGRIYASRRDARSDWCRNALRNPAVAVEVAGQRLTGIASLVTDCTLRQKISQLKYGDRRNLELRTVIEITPGGAQ
jgi:hypothetical protein